jgi:hypothetical protein
MSIKRAALSFEGKFTQMPNAWLRDKKLSRRARGLLAELMSHSVGWTINFQSLEQSGPEGREALQSAIRELKDAGYLRIEQARDEKSNTFGEVHYVVCEPVNGFPVERVSRSTASPLSGKPATKNTNDLEDQEKEEQGPRKRGSRISESFAVDEAMRVWAAVNAPSVDVVSETETFKEYWGSKAGRDAVKVNWRLTWQSWMRRQHGWNVDRGWKPAASVGNASDELLAEQKAAWCAAHGVTVAEWDAHEHDDAWRAEVIGRG